MNHLIKKWEKKGKNAYHNYREPKYVFELLILSNLQSKTEKLLIYNNKLHKKAAVTYIKEAGTN